MSPIPLGILAASGAAGSAHILIQELTNQGGTSFTFSNIPSTFTSYHLICHTSSANPASTLTLAFNNTSNDYNYQRRENQSSQRFEAQTRGEFGHSIGVTEVILHGLHETNMFPTWYSNSFAGLTSGYTNRTYSGSQATTTSITSLTIYSGNGITGNFYLYGVE
jgi:hypothetical protein